MGADGKPRKVKDGAHLTLTQSVSEDDMILASMVCVHLPKAGVSLLHIRRAPSSPRFVDLIATEWRNRVAWGVSPRTGNEISSLAAERRHVRSAKVSPLRG